MTDGSFVVGGCGCGVTGMFSRRVGCFLFIDCFGVCCSLLLCSENGCKSVRRGVDDRNYLV